MPSKSIHRWFRTHTQDLYVRRAHAHGYRSRAAYKLLEIQRKDKLFRQGMTVLDLGAAPGGWSQVTAQCVGPKGQVIAVDILPIQAIQNVTTIQADIYAPEAFEEVNQSLKQRGKCAIDWVISDMAPNLTGVKSTDGPRAIALAERVLECAQIVLANGGGLLVKLFQGPQIKHYQAQLSQHFADVKLRKPSASRAQSAEVYVLAKQFKRE